MISPMRTAAGFDIRLKYNTKVGDFQKGYKDFKRYLRYISIIKDLCELLKKISNKETITYKTMSSPKSSLRSYKSSYKKDFSANSKSSQDLSSEPSNAIKSIKSSPKYSTYFTEK
jgi:hypothetical protein